VELIEVVLGMYKLAAKCNSTIILFCIVNGECGNTQVTVDEVVDVDVIVSCCVVDGGHSHVVLVAAII
tara:strand:+ start:817 stop:1020 length:204 start_codon:yes stop_codon:yes gene_type:complete